jgi:hypothetical protein
LGVRGAVICHSREAARTGVGGHGGGARAGARSRAAAYSGGGAARLAQHVGFFSLLFVGR